MFTPPTGTTFSSNTLSPPDLARALGQVASFVQSKEPPGAHLHKSDDWLEHDGLWFESTLISLNELFKLVESPRSLLAAMPEDDNVFIGITSDSKQWYLRFYLGWDDEGFELSGRFDITLAPALTADFRQSMTNSVSLVEQESTAYFARLT